MDAQLVKHSSRDSWVLILPRAALFSFLVVLGVVELFVFSMLTTSYMHTRVYCRDTSWSSSQSWEVVPPQ